MDLGSGIRKKPIPDPGSRGQKGTGSRIRIRNTGSRIEYRKNKKVLDEGIANFSDGCLRHSLAGWGEGVGRGCDACPSGG
jgi:hypothetical protein